MKKLIFVGILGLFVLGSCNNSTVTHTHNEHDHATEGHNHEAEGSDHSHEGECSGEHNHEATDGHNESAEAHSDEIILPKAKAEAAGVKVSVIEPAPLIKTSGQVLAAQGDESVAVATVAGVVSFRGKVTEGMSVGSGTPLVTISSKNIADGDPVQRARIAYEVSKKEYERMKELVKNKIVSDKDFAQAEQSYENARLSYEALSKNHSAIGQSITAPIAGYVKSILVKEGDYVTTGQPLMTLTQNRRLQLRADVSERYYGALKQIASAHFKTPYDDTVYALENLHGRVLSYGKASDENAFYIPVLFEFDNTGDIVPGSFVETYLTGATRTGVITLPVSALTEEQGLYFVYLQESKEVYRKQEVKTGAEDGLRVEILSGLKPGDRVVTQGAYHVKLASASNAIPAHNHSH